MVNHTILSKIVYCINSIVAALERLENEQFGRSLNGSLGRIFAVPFIRQWADIAGTENGDGGRPATKRTNEQPGTSGTPGKKTSMQNLFFNIFNIFQSRNELANLVRRKQGKRKRVTRHELKMTELTD